MVYEISDKTLAFKEGQTVVEVDTKYYRPTEVDLLIGNAAKAREKLKWEPKFTLEAMIEEMVKSDLELFRRDKYLSEGGHKVKNYHE